jgi:hypothetical protein
VHDFLHVVLSGPVRYEVLTAGKCLHYTAEPGTTFVLREAPSTNCGGRVRRIALLSPCTRAIAQCD